MPQVGFGFPWFNGHGDTRGLLKAGNLPWSYELRNNSRYEQYPPWSVICANHSRLASGWQSGQEFRPPPDWDAGFEFSGNADLADAGAYSDFFEALFGRVRGRPLPGWAAEIDCANWAQLLLKFVVSHPAVTCAIPATTRVEHMLENMGAGFGRLPDAALRRRIVAELAGP
jgi:hypothetical protein